MKNCGLFKNNVLKQNFFLYVDPKLVITSVIVFHVAPKFWLCNSFLYFVCVHSLDSKEDEIKESLEEKSAD